MGRASTLLTVILVLIAGVGCGTSDEERVERVFKEWLVANLENDHERVCALMTPGYRRHRYDVVGETSFEDCLTEERRRATPATPRQRRAVEQVEQVEQVEIAKIEVEGETALGYLGLRGCTLSHTGSEFRRVATGQWRYDGPVPSIGREPRCLR